MSIYVSTKIGDLGELFIELAPPGKDGEPRNMRVESTAS